jgi:ABC-type multidrug transport system fused ATPase/permease subunit
MVGLEPSIEHYFIFLSILFTFSVLMNQMLAVFASVASTKPTVQVMCACLLLFLILFGGFIVPPNVIPDYYIWIYWWNPFAWAYRALLVNEFQSGSYEDGDAILAQVGFLYGIDKGMAFQKIWVVYWFIYMVPHFLFCVFLTALGLTHARSSQKTNTIKTDTKGSTLNAIRSSKTKRDVPSNGSSTGLTNGEAFQDETEESSVEIPFVSVTLTFENICYDIKASQGSQQLRLLKNVNGMFKAGRMCALMGSSGAGKVSLVLLLLVLIQCSAKIQSSACNIYKPFCLCFH